MSRESKRLLEERAKLVKEMQGLIKLTGEENRSMTAEEQEKFARLDKDQEELKSRADTAHRAEQLGDELEKPGHLREELGGIQLDPKSAVQRRARFAQHLRSWFLAGTDVPVPQQAIEAAQADQFPLFSRSITLRLDRGSDELGFPHGAPKTRAEVLRQLERRAQSVGTTTAGGHTVPDEMMAAIDVALLRFGGMRQVATILSTDTGADLPIPTSDDTSNTGEIIGENSEVNEQDVTFGQVVLEAYKYSSKMIKVSVELLQDSSINLPVFLGQRLGERIGRITNTHFTTGTGTSQPRGVVTAAADSSITLTTDNDPTYDELIGIKHSVDPAYRDNGRWMFHDTVLANIKMLKDSQNNPIWKPSLAGGTPDTIDGDPYVVNQDMPTSGTTGTKVILYGDLSKYHIRETREIVLLRLDERFAEFHQVAFLAFARMDGDLVDAGTNPVKYADNP